MEIISKFIVSIIYFCCVYCIISVLPYYVNLKSHELQDVSFFLYTDENFNESHIDPTQLCCRKSCHVDRLTDVFFIIHGWLQSVNESYVKDIRELLFHLKKKKNALIVEVDWSKYAKRNYDDARNYNEVVAQAISDEISRLMKDQKISPANIEIICHCMGCHIAGLTGKNILNATGEKIGRITALDPAGPAYSHLHQSRRLEPNDAAIVFVVHTDAFVFGYGERCGTIDFYPNGGKYPQPGCREKWSVMEHDMCSHQKSVKFYIESLNCFRFSGIECETYESYIKGLCSSNRKVDFSGPLKKEHSGTYYIKTNSKKPYFGRL